MLSAQMKVNSWFVILLAFYLYILTNWQFHQLLKLKLKRYTNASIIVNKNGTSIYYELCNSLKFHRLNASHDLIPLRADNFMTFRFRMTIKAFIFLFYYLLIPFLLLKMHLDMAISDISLIISINRNQEIFQFELINLHWN